MSAITSCENCNRPVLPNASTWMKENGHSCPTDGFCMPCARKDPPNVQTPENAQDGLKNEAPEHINTRVEDLAESYIVVAITNDLEAAGYHVIRNGQRNAKRAGSGKDSPDLIITGGDIEPGMGKLLEVKVPHGWKYHSKEQRIACECGWVTRVHSVADARRAVGVK